jgi:hypothetical protein
MEFSGYSDRRYAAEYASTALQGSAYLKEDGSLDTGFELVTNPMSFDYLMNEADDLWKVIEQLKNRFTARSYNTSTCGFHIHVSRTGFNGGSHMHRFLNLIYSNEFLFSKLAGRKSERWAKFDDVNGEQVEWERDKNGNRTGRYKIIRGRQFKRKLDGSSDRYSAVNTLNEATLELRIFKGTMSKTALLAHIQLAHASVEYTRGLSVADVRNDALHADNFIRYIQDHAEIYPDLLQRLESKELIGAVYLKREPIAMITEGVDERMAERYKEYMKEMEARQTSMISEEIAPPRPSMSEDMLDRLLNEYISSMGNSIGRNGTV